MITYGKNRKVLSAKGEKFGRLTVIGNREVNDKGRPEFECVCECGTITTVQLNYLTTGQTKSCGCLLLDAQNSKKGLASKYPKEYKSWLGCRSRCNPTHKSNEEYVKNDIQVCYGWDNLVNGFTNFMEDMGERPEPKNNYSLERKDVRGDYEPSNCRWATKKDQARNKTSTRYLTYKAKTQCLQAWADETGLNRSTITTRIDRDSWSIEEALTTPSSVQHVGRNDKSRQDTGMHLEYKGENLSLRQWSKRTGISMQTLRNRSNKGWNTKDILHKPAQAKQ